MILCELLYSLSIKQIYEEDALVKDELKEKNIIEDDEPILEKINISTKHETIVDDKKYTCDCGSLLNKNGKTKHEQSLKHKKFIDSK